MKPSLPHDVCRCLGLDCDSAETCLRYLCRQDVGPGTPFIQGGAFVDGKCLYRMPDNDDGDNQPKGGFTKSESEELAAEFNEPCPDCYGGHFRPCQWCGDTGRVDFIPNR